MPRDWSRKWQRERRLGQRWAAIQIDLLKKNPEAKASRDDATARLPLAPGARRPVARQDGNKS